MNGKRFVYFAVAILGLTASLKSEQAMILNCTLAQQEVRDAKGNVSYVPVVNLEGRATDIGLTLTRSEAGNWIAKGGFLALSVGDRISRLQKDNATGTNGSQWFYVMYNLGVIVIELKPNNQVVVSVMGAAPYTMRGACK